MLDEGWRSICAPYLRRCRFPGAGAEVVCAVSGGADSVALLLLAAAAGCRAHAVYVDHGLRAGGVTRTEAGFVASVAADVGASFERTAVTVEPGPNLEARARAARYLALPPGVLVGHTADDLAETVLVNLMRGAGLEGLSPMTRTGETDGAGPRRPLLALRRADTQALCRAVGVVPVDDEMNHNPRFLRVRVRREVLPLLCDVAGRDVVPILARQAAMLADEALYLNEAAAALDATDARALAGASPALARRSVRRWLLASGYGLDIDGVHPPPLAVVERVLAVARGEAAAADLDRGWRVARTRQRLRLIPPAGGG